MKRSRLSGVVCACLLMFGINAGAAVVRYDISGEPIFELPGITPGSFCPTEGCTFAGTFEVNDLLINQFQPVSNFFATSTSIAVEPFTTDDLTVNSVFLDANGNLTTLDFEVFLLSDPNSDYFASITESSWHLHAVGNVDFPVTTTAGVTVTVIPIPPAVWLFGSGLLGLVGISRRKK